MTGHGSYELHRVAIRLRYGYSILKYRINPSQGILAERSSVRFLVGCLALFRVWHFLRVAAFAVDPVTDHLWGLRGRGPQGSSSNSSGGWVQWRRGAAQLQPNCSPPSALNRLFHLWSLNSRSTVKVAS